jgi:hypothetical protein
MLSIVKQFLVEQETPQCQKGYHWCVDTKKCVPIGSGSGTGPRRKRPRNERREIVKEPPIEVDGDIKIKKIKELLSSMLDEVYKLEEDENALDNIPNQEPEEEMESLKKDIAESLKFIEESEYQKYFETMMKKFGVTKPSELKGDKKKEFFDAIEKGWTKEKSVNEVDRILDEHAYGDFFLGMLKKFNVTGIMQLSVDKKKEFFNAIKSGWAAKKKDNSQ